MLPSLPVSVPQKEGDSVIVQLFLVFLQIGLLSIGGGYAVIPMIQEWIVLRCGWLGEQAFLDVLAISQMTPGPLAVNASTFVGMQIAGFPGALAATLGCILAGSIISLILFAFFRRHQGSTLSGELLNGLRVLSAGLIASACATILTLTFWGESGWGAIFTGLPHWKALIIFGVALLLLRRKKTGPIPLMLLSGAAGWILYGIVP